HVPLIPNSVIDPLLANESAHVGSGSEATVVMHPNGGAVLKVFQTSRGNVDSVGVGRIGEVNNGGLGCVGPSYPTETTLIDF
ncbi:hypothetical protein R0K19_26675, partial [Bacillus sp. SIMBA_161]